MIKIAATIEHHFLDARLKRALGHELAHGSRRRKVAALRQIAFEVLVQGRSGSNRLAGAIVDHLCIDMLRGAEHRQTRAPVGRSPKRGTDPARTPHEAFIQRAHGLVLLLLAFLAEDELARVFHALALVGLRRPEPPDFRRDLANLLLVDAAYHNLGRLRTNDLDAFRDRVAHVVAIAELELHVRALHRGAIADTGDLELLGEAFRDAGHQLGDHGPAHAPHGARLFGVLAHGHFDAALIELGHHGVGEDVLKLALGAPHRHLLAVHRGSYATRSGPRLFANPRHRSNLRYQSPA